MSTTKIKWNSVNSRMAALICGLFFLSSLALAGGVDDVHVLKITAQDQRAVIKMPGGKVQVIKEGDVLRVTGGELQVVEIADGRVIFEEQTERGTERVIIRLGEGKQKVERMKKQGEKLPLLYAPVHEGQKK